MSECANVGLSNVWPKERSFDSELQWCLVFVWEFWGGVVLIFGFAFLFCFDFLIKEITQGQLIAGQCYLIHCLSHWSVFGSVH